MTDNIAILDRYIVEIMAKHNDSPEVLFLLVRPDADFTRSFKAWDMDEQEFYVLDGREYTVEVL